MVGYVPLKKGAAQIQRAAQVARKENMSAEQKVKARLVQEKPLGYQRLTA